MTSVTENVLWRIALARQREYEADLNHPAMQVIATDKEEEGPVGDMLLKYDGQIFAGDDEIKPDPDYTDMILTAIKATWRPGISYREWYLAVLEEVGDL